MMSVRAKQDERRKAFKKGIDVTDSRRRREDKHASIRKNKREELALKRRNITFDEESSSTSVAPRSAEDAFLMSTEADADLSRFISLSRSSDPNEVLVGVRSIRKILSRESKPPIDIVIASGIVHRFVELLGVPHKDIQFEAAWALTNIASGTSDHTKCVIDAGAVPAFVAMSANAESLENREQATWALGNIAGDSCQCRDYVLSCNALEPLLHNLQTTTNKSFLCNGTWTLSNLVRGKPAPNFTRIKKCLGVLYRLLNLDDEDVLGDACWALSYLTDGEDHKLQAVIEEGLVPRLIDLLYLDNTSVLTPALRTVGNLVTGTQYQTQAVIDLGGLEAIEHIMDTQTNRNMLKECVWALSNVTAGTTPQIDAIMNGEFLSRLIALCSEGEFEIRKEAAWAVTNAISGGTSEQIIRMVQAGCLKVIVEFLSNKDTKLLIICLEAVEKIMGVGDTLANAKTNQTNPYALEMESNGGLEAIEELQNHSQLKIHEIASKLLEEYFEGEDENVFEQQPQQQPATALAPQQPNNFFSFGAPPSQSFNMSGNFVFSK